jgi:hypothetical protein
LPGVPRVPCVLDRIDLPTETAPGTVPTETFSCTRAHANTSSAQTSICW